MKKKQLSLEYIEVSRLEKFDPVEQRLVSKAKAAALKAYSPYSGFQVGAAVLLENGEIFSGSNQENTAFPSGLCAERIALFAAATDFPDVPVRTLAVTAWTNEKYVSTPITPCGSCRQVIVETQKRFKNPVRLILYAEEKSLVFDNGGDLLPLPFDKF